MEDIVKTKGPTKATQPESGGANIRGVPVLGIVKNNIDPIRSGRIQVYIADFGSTDPEDEAGWVTVSYMTPFFGSTKPGAPDTGYGSYVANPSSYGVWNSPPDIGSTVVCIFINGDPVYGYYIGCVPQPESLHMVPAIGSSTDVILNNAAEGTGYGGATRLPVTNINTNNDAVAEGPAFLTEPKPVHSYVAAIMNQQGLIRDPIRGPITSGAQRESPSRVGWGVSTPGRPIYEGGFSDESIAGTTKTSRLDPKLKVIARRGGHSIVMDDGDLVGTDQLIRIRSAAGHQILMSDDGQTLFIIHSNGQSYIELGKEGTIDMFSTNSVNIRTQGELNFHADQDININTKTKLNIQADSIHVNSDKEMTHKVGTNYQVQTVGNYTHKVDGSTSMSAGGTADFTSVDNMYHLGKNIYLNSGGPAMTPAPVTPKPLIGQSDTLFSPATGFSPAPGALPTIVSRAPAHSPWANANQGVNVKTTQNASAVLPAAASPAVAATNTTAAASPPRTPVTPAVVSSVPATPAISAALPAPVAGSMIAAASTNAATGPLAKAVATGAGIVPTSSGLVAAVGSFAQSPMQLEAAGICKPGTGALITSLVQGGANLSTAFSPSMFTGLNGVTSLDSFVQSIPAQISTQITSFQQAQTELTNASVITGNESAGSVAGLVMSAASQGAAATISAVKNMSGIVNPAGINMSGEMSAVTNEITSGNFAAKLAEAASSGAAAVSGAITESSGPVSAAFEAIKNSFKKLEVGVPQNLEAISGGITAPTASDINALVGNISSIPGVSTIKGLIDNSSTAATNNISLQQSIEGASAEVTNKISELSAGLGSLQASVQNALSPENTAKLSSALASLTAAIPSAVKLPVVGANSNDRSEITSQINSVLSDLKIPKPNFGTGPSDSAKSAEEVSKNLQEVVGKAKEVALQAQTQIDAAKKKFYEVSNTLAQGSPEIDAAKKAWFNLLSKQTAILAALDRSTLE